MESLHHFTREEKTRLYQKLCASLKEGGYFILTDYFSAGEKEERLHREELARLKALQGITDDTFYHYDTPLTVQHETEAMLTGGFSTVEILGQWGATCTIKAAK